MIENFEPQPYPLECSVDGVTWSLVVGWQKTGDGRLTPIGVVSGGGLGMYAEPSVLQYRPAGSRVVRGALEPQEVAPPDRRRGSDRPPSRA